MSEFESILVYSPSWIGDTVMSLGALRSIRARYPGARITVLARPWVKDLYPGCEAVDVTLGYDRRGIHRGPFGFLRLTQGLREERFDLALLFPNAFRAAAVAWAARVPERWGYGTDGRSLLLTRVVPPAPRPFGRHQVFYYLDLLNALGISTGIPDNRLHLTHHMKERARSLLTINDGHDGERFVGIHPGATNSSAKRWIPERYAKVGERLAHLQGARVVLLGGPRERPLAEEIRSFMNVPVTDLAGKTSLADLMGVIGSLSILVTNDSGPMHLSAALGTPTVAVFGPTDERETGPVGEDSRVIRRQVTCSPCLLKDCPIDHRCMYEVEVDEVVATAVGLLEKRNRASATGAASR